MNYQSKEDSATTVRFLSVKLRSIAYLIENHHDDVGEPLDIEDIFYGIGALLSGISQELKTISIQMEKKEIKSSQRKKS